MTDVAADSSAAAGRSRMPLVFGVLLACLGAGGGFYLVRSGLLPLGDSDTAPRVAAVDPLPNIAFVPLDPLIVSLSAGGRSQNLHFRAQLEVNAAHEADVTSILPRVTDVLNGYLRAIDLSDIRDPMALTRLRAQMLRRVQVVAGQGRVRDLLIMEFVLN